MKREKLIEYRRKLKLTQAEIAERYEVTQQAWNKWEMGAANPTVDKMKRLEVDSGIPMEELFADAFDKETARAQA